MIENLERHESEYIDALEKIWKQCQHISECKYFLDTEFAWAKYKTRPRVVVLGTDIPEELVYAASAAVPFSDISTSPVPIFLMRCS